MVMIVTLPTVLANFHPDGTRSITRYAATECTSAYAREHTEFSLKRFETMK
jgi:hypothetical protein